MYWAFQSPVFYGFVDYTSKGSTIIHLYQDTFINLPFLLPSIEEQASIIKFLDEKAAKIDKLIVGKRGLIELLKEERSGVVNDAITRGINPHVKLKPLGIDWLGEIPEHWKVKKLKYVAEMQGGFAFNSSDYVTEGIQLIKIGNLYQNDFLLERQPTFLPEHYLEEYKEWVVENGDILISMTGTLGKRDYGYAIQNEKADRKFLLNQRVSRIRFNVNELQKEFALHILRSNYYLDQLFILPTGTKQGNLSNEQVLSIPIIFPKSLSEQKQIVQFIEAETGKIDATVAKIEKEIEYLREYRTALISEVVTGKIDVRNYADGT
jgi:type I restriction enzyme S subunit